MSKRFGRLLGHAWWHGTALLPVAIYGPVSVLDRVLEEIPGFTQGELDAYRRHMRPRR